jgi:hypothetical protein
MTSPTTTKLTRSARKRRAGLPSITRPETLDDAKLIAETLQRDGVTTADIERAIRPFRLADLKTHPALNFPVLTKSAAVRCHLTKTVHVAKAAVEGRTVRGVISTSTVDRVGDILLPRGCQTRNYLMNPIVYNSHRYSDLPVGRCTRLEVADDIMVAWTEFAPRPSSLPASSEWLPDTLLSLYQQGVLKGWSVGLNVIAARPPTRAELKEQPTASRVITNWELIEYSVASIPMNPEAITRSNTSTEPLRVRIVLPA